MPSRPHGSTRRRPSIDDLRHRIAALGRHHAHLEARLCDALAPPMPDMARVKWIKAEKLWVKDEIAHLAAEIHRRARPRRGRVGGVASPAIAVAPAAAA